MEIVFHGILNNTGAARYLLDEILPGGSGVLITWAPAGDLPDGWCNIALSTGLKKTGRASGILWRLKILVKQFFFVVNRCREADAIHINSISNLGAIAAIGVLSPSIKVILYAHESPIGKWRQIYRFIKLIYRGKILTVSPYMQSELARVGLLSGWAYPKTFLATYVPDQALLPSDVMMVAHPDESKGFNLIRDIIKGLPPKTSIRLYLSRAPLIDFQFPPNVNLILGKSLEPSDYKARLCILATNPVTTKETFSYITAESLSAGVPVVCSPSGGVSEQLIHLVNGYFVTEYHSQAFIDAVNMLLKNSVLCATLAEGARMCNAVKTRSTHAY